METITDSLIQEFKDQFEKLKASYAPDQPPNANITSEGDKPTEEVTSNFEELIKKIDENLKSATDGTPVYIKLLSMKASLYYEQAKIHLVENRLDESRKILEKTVDYFGEHANHNELAFLYLRIINHLSYLCSKNNELERARKLLENVVDKKYDPEILLSSTEEIFSDTKPTLETGEPKFKKLMINNLQMLSWVYGRLELHDLHTSTEHRLLQEILELDEVHPVHWTNKCSRLAILFLSKFRWSHARHYLISAGEILDQFESKGKSTPLILAHARADLARAWVHYGLHLYGASKKHMLEQLYDNDGLPKEDDPVAKPEEEIDPKYFFKDIGVKSSAAVPASIIKNTQDARVLFVHTQTWLKRVRMFYTLREHPLQYVNSVLDLSEVYRFLAFYEADLDAQYNVQRRRSEALEALSTLLREVKPNCYIAVSVELWRELAEVQIELMGINLKRLYSYEGEYESEESLKRRMNAVTDVHDKLDSMGEMIGPTATENPPTKDAEVTEKPGEVLKEQNKEVLNDINI